LFSNEFLKTSGLVEDDRADVTSRSLDGDVSGINASGAKNQLVRGRNPRNRGSSQSASKNVTSNFNDDKVQDPERTSFQKSWYNSRYPG